MPHQAHHPNLPSSLFQPHPPPSPLLKRDNATVPAWQTLPATPTLPTGGAEHHLVRPDGASIWYSVWAPAAKYSAVASCLPPVVFLHGGFSSSDWWGHQITALVAQGLRTVVAIDSRYQGRSTGAGTLSYDAMMDDVVAVFDALNVSRAAVIGWSDGGDIGLNMLQHHPDRLSRLLAFGANYNVSGMLDTTNSSTVAAYTARATALYQSLNPSPDLAAVFAQIGAMWAVLPAWTQADFARVARADAKRVWMVAADHDEVVDIRQISTIANWLAGGGAARYVEMKGVSHFAFVQDVPQGDAVVGAF
ncbi:alpha/beta hydrolase fold protein [Zopfochytrium polystomum]|nr:alpha/beta hydrolase fold protein [Zopfochytrium polystomum]